MDKKDIVEVLERIGTMMEIKGENPFKVRAYFSGARTLQTMEGILAKSSQRAGWVISRESGRPSPKRLRLCIPQIFKLKKRGVYGGTIL